MGFTNVIRRSACLVPSAIRATRSQTCYHHNNLYTLFPTAATITPTAALSQNLFCSSFSTVVQRRYPRKGSRVGHSTTETTRRQSDQTLVKLIGSEIKCAEFSEESYEVDDVPESFPFEIEDEPGQGTVTLTRNDHGESITVEVHMPEVLAGEEDDSVDDDSETENEPLEMVVRISKNGGPCLEFEVSAHPDKIEIESLSVKDPGAGYEGPEFEELDENIQKAFHKYLDIRGINTSTMNFLYDYMIYKDSKEYLIWLKKIKKVVEA